MVKKSNMKINFMYFLFVSVFTIGCRQGELDCSERYNEDGHLEAINISLDDQENHSLVVEFYPGGGIKEHYHVRHDTLDGPCTSFYENGQIKHMQYQQSGSIVGHAIYYYPSGEIEQISNYKEGKLNGERYYYRTDRKLKAFDKLLDGFKYFDRMWEYEGDSISKVKTRIYPVLQRNVEKEPADSDSLVMVFRLPLNDAEFEQKYIRMNTGISTWSNRSVRDSTMLTDLRFENDVYEYPLNVQAIDSIDVWAVIRYIKNSPETVFDTFYQSIILNL